MFLSAPEIRELQNLEMPTLVDMLVYHTQSYFTLLRLDGVTNTTRICRESVENIQAAIRSKRELEKQTPNTLPDITIVKINSVA